MLLSHVQVGQARIIAEAIAAMRAAAGGTVALFLVGDFNSTAGSAVYRFITDGFLDCAGEDRRDLSGQLMHDHDFSTYKAEPQVRGITPNSTAPRRQLMPWLSKPKLCPNGEDWEGLSCLGMSLRDVSGVPFLS